MKTEPTIVEEAIEEATERAYLEWSAEHPSLARVIDRMQLVERTATSLRRTPEFRRAVQSYQQAGCEMCLVTRLSELAGPVIRVVLGL